ncbi:MAG: 50S ribosomal protein L28 [Gammaproteobacteria bacterium]
MSRVCDVTGIKPQVGNNVSHSKRRTKRRWLPNLHVRRFWVDSRNGFIKLRVSNKGLRLIDKWGIEKVLETIAKRKKGAE